MISNISIRKSVFVRKLEAYARQMGKTGKGGKYYIFVNSAVMIVLLFTAGFQA